eukprot:GFYU01000037.1.p1 GENE.GFYU01000037.1~~GFYU01000037.1.p1  ORF type:complete len:861 (+),score=295.01 GFYU01000037.1:145-2727(+)
MTDAPADAVVPKTSYGVQAIDFDGNFCNGLIDYFRSSGLIGTGLDYHIVSIFGCQSSGKSTLLNLLFGTKFEVMNADEARSQTTKGVWAGKSSGSDILVVDLEGCDSRERGEAAGTFERQAALFALSLSEVVIVNMWANDLGRYNASNYGLLRTVFEVNLQLFEHESRHKTLLHFVLRDHVKTPLDKLRDMIKVDMETIWSSLSKPERFAESDVSDFFDLDFTSLPHYEFARDDFTSEVEKLQSKFYNKEHPYHVFQSGYHRGIPADGLVQYAEGIWQVIRDNKDLNLPTQREMLALYRCDEIKENAYSTFVEELAPVRAVVASNKIAADMGETGAKLLAAALVAYDGPASRYKDTVFQRKRAELEARIVDDLSTLFFAQLRNIEQETKRLFNTLISAALGASGQKAADAFHSNTHEALMKAESFFQEKALNSKLASATWVYDDVHDDLVTAFKEKIAEERLVHMERLLKEIHAHFDEMANEPICGLFDSAPNAMWKRVREVVAAAKNQTHKEFAEKIKGYNVTAEESKEFTESLDLHAKHMVISETEETLKYILRRMHERFDKLFKHDSEGIPRTWTESVNIRDIFIEARDSALGLLNLFSVAYLDEPASTPLRSPGSPKATTGDDNSIDLRHMSASTSTGIILRSQEQVAELRRRFENEIEVAYKEAEQMRDRKNSAGSLPWWVWGMFIFLGYDDVLDLLMGPSFGFLLMLALMGGGALYVAHTMGKADLVIAVGKQVGIAALEAVKKGLEQVSAQATANPSGRVSTRASSGSIPRGSVNTNPLKRYDTAPGLLIPDEKKEKMREAVAELRQRTSVDDQAVGASSSSTNATSGGSPRLVSFKSDGGGSATSASDKKTE